MGASAAGDGNHVYIFPANGANTPVEIFESDTPLIVEKRELHTDSGGPGRLKGGLGRQVVFRIPDDAHAPRPPVNLGIQSGRYRYPPEGLFGGMAGSRATFLVNGKPGNPYGLTRLQPGDVVTMDAAGGGGYGNPLEREIELVASDVLDGYVSLESARETYGVVINPETMEVDREATLARREARRKGQAPDSLSYRTVSGRRSWEVDTPRGRNRNGPSGLVPEAAQPAAAEEQRENK